MTCRWAAARVNAFGGTRYRCHVTGIDLTSEFIETGREPCRWVGLASSVSLHQGNALAGPHTYKTALRSAGFEMIGERERRDFALSFFDEQRARLAAAGGPLPLGFHVLMGESRAAKVANTIANNSAGVIAPVEIIARKA